MRISGRIIPATSLFFGALLLVPLSLNAQMRAAPMARTQRPAFHSIAVAPSPTHGLAVPRARINTASPAQTSTARMQTFAASDDDINNIFLGGSGETLQELLDPVPSPGFDYAHLAALDRDLAIKAVIDPETEWRLAVAERVLRDSGGLAARGFFLLDGGGEYILPSQPAGEEAPQQSQPPEVIVLQQPAQKAAQESAPAVSQPAAPVPDVGNFTLVLRNGKKIQAIAFTRSAGRILYISPDGERHSLAAGELDIATTQQVNEDRGTQLTL